MYATMERERGFDEDFCAQATVAIIFFFRVRARKTYSSDGVFLNCLRQWEVTSAAFLIRVYHGLARVHEREKGSRTEGFCHSAWPECESMAGAIGNLGSRVVVVVVVVVCCLLRCWAARGCYQHAEKASSLVTRPKAEAERIRRVSASSSQATTEIFTLLCFFSQTCNSRSRSLSHAQIRAPEKPTHCLS
jgi:hypothetical protein